MNNLNSVQRKKIKKILNNAKTMKDSDLETLRCDVSKFKGDAEIKDAILDGIKSIMEKRNDNK